MIRFFERDGHICFKVRVQPGCKQCDIAGCREEALHIRLSAPAVEDRANRQLVDLLAEFLEVPKSRIRLLRGHKTRLKTVQVLFLPRESLVKALTPYLAPHR